MTVDQSKLPKRDKRGDCGALKVLSASRQKSRPGRLAGFRLLEGRGKEDPRRDLACALGSVKTSEPGKSTTPSPRHHSFIPLHAIHTQTTYDLSSEYLFNTEAASPILRSYSVARDPPRNSCKTPSPSRQYLSTLPVEHTSTPHPTFMHS